MMDKHLKQKKRSNKPTYLRITILLLSGVIMIGHATRMIYQGVFHQGSSYTPNTFDIFFDWTTLLILGIIILLLSLTTFYHLLDKKNLKEKTQDQLITNPS